MDNRQRKTEPGDIHHRPGKRLQGHSNKKENEKEEKCISGCTERQGERSQRRLRHVRSTVRQAMQKTTNNIGRHSTIKATKTVRQVMGDFEIKLAAEIKRECKSFFSYAKSKLRTKEQIGPLLYMTGNLTEEPKLMVMLLNELFSSVFTTEDQTNIPSLEYEVELVADATI